MGAYTTGIAKIEFGAVAGDGGPGTTLAALGLTSEGTGKLNQADPTTTEFRVEEQDQPVFTVNTPGAITFDMSLANPDVDALIALFGGTATGTSPNRVWNMPASIPTLIQTVKITPTTGFKSVTIPKGQVVAKLNGALTRQDLFQVDITVTALAPDKANIGPLQFTI